MINQLKKFFMDESALETAEKAALVVLALIIAVGAITAIAPNIKASFEKAIDLQNEAKSFTY